MTVAELSEKLGLEIFAGKSGLGNPVGGGYVSDLLSDVMGNASEGNVWITLQTHNNVVAVASLRELSAIILVKGLKPSEETIKSAEKEGIPLLGTKEKTFEISGKLYNLIGM